MTKETLEKDIKDATVKLLEMARSHSWNSISDDCVYILSENLDAIASNFNELRKLRKRLNDKKNPKSLNQIIVDLKNIYSNLYDINLYVYKAKLHQTIVEIQYDLKSTSDKEYFEKVKDYSPMMHCKVPIPPYSFDNKEKFDINWELGGLSHRWKLFWGQRKVRKRK